RTIGILGTPGTVRRAYTQALLDQFAPDCGVVRVGSGELVQLAERRLRGGTGEIVELQPILAPFVADERCGTIVLACTPFPRSRPRGVGRGGPHVLSGPKKTPSDPTRQQT